MACDSARSWLFLAIAFLGQAVIYGSCASGSLYNAYLLDAFVEARSFTAVPFGLATGIMMIGGVLVTPIINRFGIHVAMGTGAVLMSLGLAVSAFTPGVGLMVASFGIIAGLGMSFGYMALSVAVSGLFYKYRTLALAVSSTGLIFGVMTYPTLVHLCTSRYAWRGSLLILSGVSLNLLIPATMLYHYNSKRNITKQGETDDVYINSQQAVKTTKRTKLFHWDILKNKVFLLVLLASFCRAWAKSAIYVHITAIGLHTLLDHKEAPHILLVMGSVQLVARPVAGVIGSFINRRVIIWSLCALISGVWLSLGMFFTSSRGAFYGYLVAYGANDGMIDALWIPVIVDVTGQKRMSSALGVGGFVYGSGLMMSPPIAGLLFDTFHSYNGTFLLSGISCLLAALVGFTAAVVQERRKNKSAMIA